MRFKNVLLDCIRCKKVIPQIDRGPSRKYCKECSVISIKENRKNHMRVSKGIAEKPCWICTQLTFRHKFCSDECSVKYRSLMYAIKAKKKYTRLLAETVAKIEYLTKHE